MNIVYYHSSVILYTTNHYIIHMLYAYFILENNEMMNINNKMAFKLLVLLEV